MIKTYLTGFPWDLTGACADDVLDVVHGEVGASGVAVWLGLGPLTLVRPARFEPRVMHTRGGLFFHPDETQFEATRLKPIHSTGLTSRDWLGDLAAACRDRGLALRALLTVGRLGCVAQRHPDMACKNVFGAPSQTGVCLSNPDVRAFLTALIRELDERGTFDSIVLADSCYSWTEAWEDPSPCTVPIRDTERALLSICYCESCLQAAGDAGVDIAAARRSNAVLLDSLLEAGTSPKRDLSSAVADSEALCQWLRWRGQSLSDVWRALGRERACDVVVALGSEPARSTFFDLDYSVVSGVLSSLEHRHDRARASCSSARRHELHVPAGMCIGDHGPELVATLTQCAETGCSTFQIDGDAVFTETGAASVKQAIRFIKRGV